MGEVKSGATKKSVKKYVHKFILLSRQENQSHNVHADK